MRGAIELNKFKSIVHMKLIKYCGAILCLCFAVSAQAGDGYFGVKVVVISLSDGVLYPSNSSVNTSTDDPVNVGIYGGWVADNGFGVEAEITNSVLEGSTSYDYVASSGNVLHRDADLEAGHHGVYGMYRSSGDNYFKARLGIAHVFPVLYGRSSSNFYEPGLSYGVGGWL